MRPDGSPHSLRDGLSVGRREVASYLAAAVAYVAIGVAFPEFLFSWVVAVAYVLLCLVVLPTLVRRRRA